MNKAISLELRYISYSREIGNYNFNPLGLGNADRFFASRHYNEFFLNIGVQVVF